MKKTYFLGMMTVLAVVIYGCQYPIENVGDSQAEPLFCTQDAKICPDGTSVARDPDNNCEFFPCGEEKPIPVEPDGGIGTTNNEKIYVSLDTAQCQLIKFQCEEGKKPFFDENGCGCEQMEAVNEGKLQAIDCADERPVACTREYMPVCGQVEVECIRAPCDLVQQTFANKCEACANERTISYTQGECLAK